MKYYLSKCRWVIICLFFTTALQAQLPAFYKEIHVFKQIDSIQTPPEHPILFIGSSSFTKWTDVQDYFPGKPILNRGFGGSTSLDVLRYAEDIIFPYHPRQVVIYVGENDIASAESVTPEMVAGRIKALFYLIRSQFPGIPIVFISLKPSIAREKMMQRMDATNKLIKQFIQAQPHAKFIDVYHLMLTKNGKPMPDIFIEDNLHMNAKGYEIWKKAIAPYLL